MEINKLIARRWVVRVVGFPGKRLADNYPVGNKTGDEWPEVVTINGVTYKAICDDRSDLELSRAIPSADQPSSHKREWRADGPAKKRPVQKQQSQDNDMFL